MIFSQLKPYQAKISVYISKNPKEIPESGGWTPPKFRHGHLGGSESERRAERQGWLAHRVGRGGL